MDFLGLAWIVGCGVVFSEVLWWVLKIKKIRIMKVFLSWSGNRSKQVAEFLSSWLEQVIQATETWISVDITKGERWSPSISNELEKTNIGIICLDKDNLDSNWILFEAGALSKMKNAMVCTFPLDIQPSDVKQPLGQFQHTLFKKEDIWKLVQDINQKLLKVGEKQVSERNLESIFNRCYSELEAQLEQIASIEANKKDAIRSDNELLDEILQTVRAIKYDLSESNRPRKIGTTDYSS